MSYDPNAEFDHTVLDKIEASPIGALPLTPAYQDALNRLYAARQVYVSADHKGGHVTARSLASLPTFQAENLPALIAGEIDDEALEPNASIYDRYVQSLPEELRARAESHRLAVIGKPILHRARHGHEVVHDPMHTLFLVPGGGPHPGLPGIICMAPSFISATRPPAPGLFICTTVRTVPAPSARPGSPMRSANWRRCSPAFLFT